MPGWRDFLRPSASDREQRELGGVTKPLRSSAGDTAFRERMEGKGSPDWLWEVQLHGRFLQKPNGPVWLRAELRDSPMQLGLVSRALCTDPRECPWAWVAGS
ncbi:unnamed protein product [Effrenium voratum]|uniref:Uncharacterized protein n=1 Tax=Effrenium voratum TaxID=2562239 RepID=A0AA36JIZ5_9DINO|nr:unnamed protein product [Effrenium voratum]